MKILMISPCPIHPLSQGNRVRIKSLVDIIKRQGHELDYLNVTKEKGDYDKDKAFFGKDHYYMKTFEYNEAISTKIRRLVKKVTDRQRLFYINDHLDDYCSDRLVDYVKSLDRVNNYDVIWVEYVFFSKILDAFGKNKLKVIDTHDMFTNRYKNFHKDNKNYRWYSISKKHEALGIKRGDVTMAIQEIEAKVYEKIADNKTKVVTVGHQVSVKDLGINNQANILFLASDNQLNKIAIDSFIENSFDYIKSEVEGVKLLLGGSIGKSIKTSDKQIIRLGFVEKLEDAYKQANIVINPIEFGTGLKIKCVEALGFGRVLITTAHGALGLDSKGNTRFIVLEKTDNFAEAIVNLLQDNEKCKNISANAIEYAFEINQKIENEINNILDFNIEGV